MRVYGYTRVSTEEQVRGGVSLEMQADRIRAYAVSQGWNLVRIFEDAGHSGTTLERPGLQAMLLRLKSIGAVLVYKVDRLSRRQKHVLNLLEDVFEPCGVRFKSVTETFDTTTPSGRAMLGMISTFSQLERDTVAQRTRDALRNKQANGGHVGAPAYGFRVVDHSLVAVPEELAIVREVKLLRVDGKTLRNIARSLNDRGLPTRRGRRWSPQGISYILHNSTYEQAAWVVRRSTAQTIGVPPLVRHFSEPPPKHD